MTKHKKKEGKHDKNDVTGGEKMEPVVEFTNENKKHKKKKFKLHLKKKRKKNDKDAKSEQEIKPLEPNVRFEELKMEVDAVVDVMRDNVVKIRDRDGKIDALLEKAVDLRASSECFQTVSGKARRKMWLRRRKYRIILISIVVGIIVMVASLLLVILLGLQNNPNQESGYSTSKNVETSSPSPG